MKTRCSTVRFSRRSVMRYRCVSSSWVIRTQAGCRPQAIRKTSHLESPLPESRDPAMDRQTMFLRDRLQKIAKIEDPDERAYEYVRLKPMIDAHNHAAYRRYIPMTRTAGMQRSKVKKKKHLL